MPTATPTRRQRWLGSLPGCLAVGSAVLAITAAILLTVFLIGPNEARLEARWERAAGFAPLATYPPRDANAAALRLETLVPRLGLEIGRQGADRATAAAKARWEQVKPELKAYFVALRVPSPALAPPSKELAAFLDEVTPTLRDVQETLRVSGPPRWGLHLEQGFHAEIPNLIGHMHVQRLLVAAAGEADRRGRRDECLKWLETAHRLQSSAAEEPLLIPQLIATTELAHELALLRALDPPPPEWRQRLAAIDPRPRLDRALRLEGWHLLHAARTGQLVPPDIKDVPLGRLLAPPMVRHGVSYVADTLNEAVDDLEHRDLRGFDGERYNRELQERVPRWNLVARLLLPGYLDAPVKGARSRLDLELTGQLLEARELLATRGVAALSTLPRQRRSGVHDFAWLYETRPDGLTIRANGTLSTGSPNALPLTVRLPL